MLSIGPAFWLVSHGYISDLAAEKFYRPIEYFEDIVIQNLPRRAAISFALASHRTFKWYLGLWVP